MAELQYIPRSRLLESLEAGFSLVPGHDYAPNDYAIIMASPGTALEADAAAIMRYFNPPLVKASNMVRTNLGRTLNYNRALKCRKGHEYTEENTRISKRGRKCRACERIRGSVFSKANYSAVRA